MDLYIRIQKSPRYFQSIAGIDLKLFGKITEKMKPVWRSAILKQKDKTGRPYGLKNLETHLLCLLIYYRTYTTQVFLGILFDVDAATICRAIKRIEPLLAKVMTIKKARKLTEKELHTIILDCTEQAIRKPRKNQARYYSGKKKRHTIKTELQILSNGRIINVSKPHAGSVHDYRVRKKSDPLPVCSRVIVDSGYQGLQHVHDKADIVQRRRRGSPLTNLQKEKNRQLSKERIPVEHKIREMKIFRIFKEKFRNPLHTYNIKSHIIGSIVNIKNGF